MVGSWTSAYQRLILQESEPGILEIVLHRPEARNALELETGNAAALQVRLNGRPEGPLGGRGEIVRRTWSR